MERFAYAQAAHTNPQSHTPVATWTGMSAGAEKPQSMSVVLMAAAIGALLVVAQQVIEAWTQGHAFVTWVALWAVAAGALVFMARPVQWFARGLARWVESVRISRMEAQMWEMARHDPRVMEEVRMAMSRDR